MRPTTRPKTACCLFLASMIVLPALHAAAPAPVTFFARRDTPLAGPGGPVSGQMSPPTAIAIADFNNDGLPDVAALSETLNELIVLTGNGDGSFHARAPINAGLTPFALVAGDFNGDGNQDLAVISLEGTGILLGNGNGSFQPLVNIRAAFGNAIAAADFNGDGKLDLVVGDSQFSTLSFLAGNGDGTFQPPAALPSPGTVAAIVAADLNGDGKTDLVVATGAGGQVVTLLNKGNGTFQPPQTFSVPGAMSLATGDFNGDGILDVACASNVGGTSALSLLLGEGGGKLGPPSLVAGEGSPTGAALVAVGDFNGDGRLDLVGSLSTLQGNYTLVLLGNGNGTFASPIKYAMGGPSALGVADFNGDHHSDILTANANVNLALLCVLLGNGSGAFQSAPQTTLSAFSAGATWVGMASADLNGDGLTDFVVAESTGVQVLLAGGAGQLTAGQFLSDASNGLVLADVNGDTHPDLVLTTANNNIQVFLGNADGTFQPPASSNAGGSQGAVAAGDFNGDGKMDLALIVNGSLGVMLGDGSGHFSAPVKLVTVGNESTSIATGDFNHDGKLDVVVANYGLLGPAGIAVLLGNGDGTFQPQTNLPVPSNAAPSDVEVADLNGDGNLDIVAANNNESYLSVYLGNGDGTFRKPSHLYSAFAPLSVLVTDLNGDGIPDIAFLSQGEEDAGFLAGKGDGTFAAASFSGANAFPSMFAAGTLTPGSKPALVLVNNGFAAQPAVAYTVLRNTSR